MVLEKTTGQAVWKSWQVLELERRRRKVVFPGLGFQRASRLSSESWLTITGLGQASVGLGLWKGAGESREKFLLREEFNWRMDRSSHGDLDHLCPGKVLGFVSTLRG